MASRLGRRRRGQVSCECFDTKAIQRVFGPVILALRIDYYYLRCVTPQLPQVYVLALLKSLKRSERTTSIATLGTAVHLDLIYVDFFLLYLFRHFSVNLPPVEYLAERSHVARNIVAVNIFDWLENLFYDEFARLAFKLCEED